METSWSYKPSLPSKGQGCLFLGLTFFYLCSLVVGQLTPEPSGNISDLSPSKTVWTLSTPAQLQTSSLAAEASASNFESGFGLTPSLLESSDTAESTSSEVGVSHGSLWLLSSSLAWQTHSTSFVAPDVLQYSTPTPSYHYLESSLSGTAKSFSSQEWVQATASAPDDTSSLQSIELITQSSVLSAQSTVFVDSVATSVRKNPAEGQELSGPSVSHELQSIPAHVDSANPTLTESSRSDSAFKTLTPGLDCVSLTSSLEDSHIQTVTEVIETTSPAVSTVTGGLDMNSTHTSTAAGETTTLVLMSTTPDLTVSSPDHAGGNGSCPEKDTGCVEYQGKDKDEEEELRMKIIVGAACGAILLVVLLGVLIGWLWKRRGKMPSGSKIDLSSYWDDSVTLSYINGHIEIPKDSADEMISLDNDSFLNSLDSMSFTNTWTSDTSKHTNL